MMVNGSEMSETRKGAVVQEGWSWRVGTIGVTTVGDFSSHGNPFCGLRSQAMISRVVLCHWRKSSVGGMHNVQC